MIQSISDKDFQRLVQFIKNKYGITLSEKRQLVKIGRASCRERV